MVKRIVRKETNVFGPDVYANTEHCFSLTIEFIFLKFRPSYLSKATLIV